MKVYGDRRSGNCDKVRFALDYLGQPYAWIEVDSVQGGTRTPEFLAKNPLGQVPVIEFSDGRCLAQSNAILRHVANGTQLLPTDQWVSAKIDEWMFWEANNHEFFIAGCISCMTYMGMSKSDRSPMRVERGNQALDIMERHLERADWLVETGFTIADIALIAYTRQAHLGGFDMNLRPRLRAWVDRCEHELGLKSEEEAAATP